MSALPERRTKAVTGRYILHNFSRLLLKSRFFYNIGKSGDTQRRKWRGDYTLKNFLLEPGGKIVFGGGCVREYLAGFARGYGPNTLLVSGVRSGRENGAYDEVCRSLRAAGKRVVELSGVQPGPDYEAVQRGARMAREQQVDLIVGVGGGSVIDCCKAIAMAAVYRGDLWTDFWARRGVVDYHPLPVGIIPTTLGTGALNGAVVLTRRADGMRSARDYPQCAPRFILFDPAYTRTLSQAQIISDGFRILSRVLELYFAPPAGENVTNTLLEALARDVVQILQKDKEQLQHDASRTDLMWAGALAGNGLLQAGKRCRYPCRRAALRLASDTGRPFTQCLAVLQSAAYRAACPERPDKLTRAAALVWGLAPDGQEPLNASAGADAFDALLGNLGLPTRPQALGITDLPHFQAFVEQAARTDRGNDSLPPAV